MKTILRGLAVLLCFALPRAEALTLNVTAQTTSGTPLSLSASVTGQIVTGVQLWMPVWQFYTNGGFLIQEVSGTLSYNGETYALGFRPPWRGDGSWLNPHASGDFYSLGYWVFEAVGLNYTLSLLNDHASNLFGFTEPSGFGFQVPVTFSARPAQSAPDGDSMPFLVAIGALAVVVHRRLMRNLPGE
jgi:hypothetical protein